MSHLLGLSDPGILNQILDDGSDNVFAMEHKSICEHAGVPGPCIPVTAAVRDIS